MKPLRSEGRKAQVTTTNSTRQMPLTNALRRESGPDIARAGLLLDERGAGAQLSAPPATLLSDSRAVMVGAERLSYRPASARCNPSTTLSESKRGESLRMATPVSRESRARSSLCAAVRQTRSLLTNLPYKPKSAGRCAGAPFACGPAAKPKHGLLPPPEHQQSRQAQARQHCGRRLRDL